MERSGLLSSIGAGFGLIVREPLSVLAWGLVMAVLTLGPLALYFAVIGPGMIDMYSSMVSHPGEVSSGMNATMMRAQALQPLQLIGSLASISIVYPAIMRAILTPGERRWAYLRIGPSEFFFAVVVIVLYVLMIVAFIVGAVVLAIPSMAIVGIAVAAGNAGAGAMAGIILILTLFAIAVGLVAAYILGRLWMGAPMTVAQKELRLFEGWVFTRGYGWKLLGLSVVILVMIFVMEFALLMALAAVGVGIVGGIGVQSLTHFFQTQNWKAMIGPLATGYFVFGAVIMTFFTPIMVAPWARAYQIIAADKDRESGAVFV